MSDISKHLANSSDDSQPQDGAAARVSVVEASHAAPNEEGAPARSEASVIELPRPPGRPKGIPKTGGRQRGTRNKRTQAVEEAMRPLVPASKRKLKKLLVSDDPKAALSAASLVLAYVYGKPVERILSDNRNVNAFEDKSELDMARAVAFLLNKAARDVGEPHPVPSCRKPEPPQPQPRVPVGKVNDLPFTKATGPEVEQVGPGPMVSPADPGNIYIEFTEPLDPELEGKVVIAKFKNARWSALHADTRQPIDPTMGEAYPHIAEAKAAAILATTTEKKPDDDPGRASWRGGRSHNRAGPK